MIPENNQLLNRFNSYWTRPVDCACWIWTGATKNGYGELNFDGRIIYCHRLSYELHRGEIPPGKLVCHLCGVRACVNPDHLYVGDKRSNGKDARNHGKFNRKLDAAKAKLIRISKRSSDDLALKFGVSRTTINKVRRGATWQ